jgi:outer membrane lipopolysaccharide assembly protein LptE/RlpB
MFRIKNLIIFFSILIFLNNCGYTPRYAKNKNVNFTIDIVEFSGDRDFNNFIKSKLKRYSKDKDKDKDNDFKKKNYKIKINTKYDKNISSKDDAGLTKEYELSITVNFFIMSESIEKKEIVEEVSFEENFTMQKMSDSFEEQNYEKIIKENFSDIIIDRLIFYLYKI